MDSSQRRADGGYFAPDSVIRRVGRESVLMLGGPRALLMQAAHPLVAAGIVEHSDYAGSPWRRLGRTLTALYTVVFGTRAEADRTGAMVRTVHERVHGRIRERMGRFPRGTRYSASDPELQLWVHATLVDTGIAMHEAYVGALTGDDREAFYDEMKLVARVFGVPREVLPGTLSDFRRYEQALIDDGILSVTAAARAVAETVIAPPVPAPLRPGMLALTRANVGLLPAALREQYGFRWTVADRLALAASSCVVRALLPLAPSPVRDVKRTGDGRNGLSFALLALAAR